MISSGGLWTRSPTSAGQAAHERRFEAADSSGEESCRSESLIRVGCGASAESCLVGDVHSGLQRSASYWPTPFLCFLPATPRTSTVMPEPFYSSAAWDL